MQLTEALLKKAVIVTSLLGIVILYFYSGTITIDTVDTLDGLREQEQVKLSGEVLSVSELEKVAFVRIANERIEVTEVVLFLDSELKFGSGDMIEVVGTTEEYEGKMQLVASTVKLVE